ncbi:hypothetical protein RMATCC62417_16606 [Rhizopus microsporus]|nr:hypothetical protein RMATCC62417_16606 [Rhizopus microsporus]
MSPKRPTPPSSTPKYKRQKTQGESSLEGILLQPDYSHFTRKYYKEYRQILRKLAEEFSLLRADAMNLGLLIISNWIEKDCKKEQFPPVTTQKFWTHCYRKVAQDPNGLNSRIKLINVIDECYEKFNATRKCPLTSECLYEIPVLDHISIHLTSNVRLYLYRTLLGFLRNAKEEQNSTYNERSIANKAADGVIQYKNFEDLDIQIDGFEQYYKKILGIYIDIFDKEKYEKISGYDYAKNNSYKLLCLGSQLLKEAAQYNTKAWSTLQKPSHRIVFAPLSGSDCTYGLLEQAHKSNLKIPAQCLTEEYSFETNRRETTLIGPTNFKDNYGSIVWQDKLWETLFNIKHVQRKRRKPNEECNNAMVELEYGWKTDGHMAAILFKRKTVERIPQDEKEMNLLKRRVNLANWSKGLYPLKKELTGLSMTDRIVGIDPDMDIKRGNSWKYLCRLRDIFVMADCSSEDVNNIKTVKKRSVKFANNEYKVHSGFDWSKQVELKNREASGMQAVYDEIPSLDSGDSNTILNYLQVLSKNRKK